MQRGEGSRVFPIGSPLPTFLLPSTTGEEFGDCYLRDGACALVAFLCNHCPYVKGSEQMLIEVVRQYQGKGLRTVAVSSNDSKRYPEDSFDLMRSKAISMDLPYPYLYDESQQVARLFDAACTPELFLFDGEGCLAYHGAINDNPRDPSGVTEAYLSNAIEAVLGGKAPSPQYVNPIGCSIKWKE